MYIYTPLGAAWAISQTAPSRTSITLANQLPSLYQQAPTIHDNPGATAPSSTSTTPSSPRTPTTPAWPERNSVSDQVANKNPGSFSRSAGENQCAYREDTRGGHHNSMSQIGSAARPASYPSTRSPVKYEHAAAFQQIHQFNARNLDSRPTLSGPNNSIGMYSILNPPDRRTSQSEAAGGGPVPPRPWEVDGSGGNGNPNHPNIQIPRTFFPGQSSASSMPGTPASANSATPGAKLPFSERASPGVGYPFPQVDTPRKLLSPKPPRRSSLHQDVSTREYEQHQHQQQLLTHNAAVKRPYENDMSEAHRQAQGSHLGPNHVAYSNGSHNASPRAPPPLQIGRSQEVSRGPPLPSTEGPGRPYVPAHLQHAGGGHSPHGGPSNDGSSLNWADSVHRSGMGVGSDGQQAYIQLPGSSIPIPIEVDYSHASRKADEKRQRNAKASTRHRKKKKVIQEDNMRQLHELREARMDLSHQMDDIIRQRDYYRDERNRLRDIVSRTQGISHHASGPPTPRASSSAGSHLERSPHNQPSHAATPPQGYASETPSIERSGQLRRMDEQQEIFNGQYGGNNALPSIHNQPSGYPPRPLSAASSGNGERLPLPLPPLRGIDGPPPPIGLGPSGPHHEQDRITGQWRPNQSRAYETGWATTGHSVGEAQAR